MLHLGGAAAAAPGSSRVLAPRQAAAQAQQRPQQQQQQQWRRRRPAVVVRAEQGAGNVCRTCGMDKSKAPGGCDGEGRVVGGLGAIPGFGWWPIKAYRPCPGLSSAGMDYVRKGQATNEMLFGGVSLSENQQESLVVMRETQEKGIDVDV